MNDSCKCFREKEMDKLIGDVETVKEGKTILEVSLKDLKGHMENWMKDMDKKLNNIGEKIDAMSTSFDERLSSLERIIFAVKWILIGGGIVGGLLNGKLILTVILKIFGA